MNDGYYIEDQNELALDDYIAIVKRRIWQFILPVVILFPIAAVVAVALPAVYRSSAVILIEQQTIPSDLVRSTVTSYADQRVQVISQRVMTTQNLGNLMETYDLYPDIRREFGLATAVEKMREDLQLEMISAEVVDPRSGRPTEATIAFSLSYDAPAAGTAQKVANEVVSLFLNENLRERKEAVREAAGFLEMESAKLAEKIDELEGELAAFKQQHGDSIPELMDVNLQLLQRTEDRLRDTEQAIRALEESNIYLEAELAQVDPYSALYSSTGERVLSPADRLRALEAEYVGLSARYSENHPDRVKMRREIDALRRTVGNIDTGDLHRQLREQRNELSSLRERFSDEHPDVKKLEREIAATEGRLEQARAAGGNRGAEVLDADNPAYIQLQAQLSGNQAKLESLRATAEELQDKLAELEGRVAAAPKVEREYRALVRDYENTMASYREVKDRQMQAQMAESLESQRKGERFVLIEPPLLPEEPYSPNRLAILFLGVVLSFGAGVGHLALREALDDGVYGAQAIQKITGAAPLAVIPLIETEAERRARGRKRLLILLAVVVGLASLAAAVHLFYRPLDVLWFKVLDKLGLARIGAA